MNTMADRPTEKVKVKIPKGECASEPFRLSGWVEHVNVFFPRMDMGIITVEASESGRTWYPVLDPETGNPLMACMAPEEPGWVNLSRFMRFIPHALLVRFVCGTAQDTRRVTLTLRMRG